MSTWASLRADFRANAPELADDAGVAAIARALGRHVPTVRFLAVLLLRAAQAAGGVARPLGAVLKQGNHVLTGCDFAFEALVGPGLILYHPTGVVVGPGCRVGARARIMQGVTLGSDAVVAGEAQAGSPVIGDDVFIGPGAIVVGPVRIGDRVRIGANAVVLSSCEDDVTLAGAPARVVG